MGQEVQSKTTSLTSKNKMAPQNKSSGSGLLAAGALAAAGAGVYYFHKDMSQEELKDASESYVAKTKEVSVKAYEGAKPYVEAAAAKTAEASKYAYGQLMSYFYPEEEQAESESSRSSLRRPPNR